MTIRKYHLAAAGAAGAAALALAACGSGPATSGPSGATPRPTATTPATTPSTPVNAADVAFATGMLRLENQAAAMAALAPSHTSTAQVRQFAAGLDEHAGEFQQMRGLMSQWGHAAPAPYAPGATPPAGSGPGMMGPGAWGEMGRMHGADFNDHFADAMIANRAAEIALCRAEIAHGASPQAQALARAMLAQRQAELTQLQAWRHLWEHDNDRDMMRG